MLRFITGIMAIVIAVLIVLVLLKITVYISSANPVDIAKTALATLAIIAFMVALQAVAQVIGLFMHVRRR